MNLISAEREAYNIARHILDKFLKDNDAILEVGCDRGEFLQELCCDYRQKRIKCIGVDPFASLSLENCGVEIRSLAAEKIGLLPERFDIVFTIMSLHHFNNKDLFITQAATALKKEGIIVIVDWRKGVDTGIRERYFSLSEIATSLRPHFSLKEKNRYRFHFSLVGEKKS